METALAVLAYAFAAALVIGAIGFARLCSAMRDRKKELDRERARAEADHERVTEKIERGARWKGDRL